ncbi:hypothetical protein V6N12_000135 [Hibiscus sabdariffa]|uniref:Uncharacterized protein n=1 Tax=Hibiscus sabdariffa TaxID=183260 RepID=A0ABR2AZ84_9ROSI
MKDVILEEDKAWDWDQKYENTIICDLEWGDQENEETDESEEGNDSESDTNIENSSSDASIGDGASNTNEGRNRAPPAWMRDYETGEGLSEEDNEACLVMSTTDDPILFEAAVKSEKIEKSNGCRNRSNIEK